jgi:hypothetical protein
MPHRQLDYWVMPPQADAALVARMENVLETYAKPDAPPLPVVCMDAQPVQWLQETRLPMPATKPHAQRIDYEYERAGTASLVMFAEPLSGGRSVRVLPQRTKVDWAREVAGFWTTRDATAAKRILVCDNLHTHTRGAFYEAFEPTRARESVRRLECCDTPKHGSWLHIAANALSAMTRQCVAHRRCGDIETLHRETSAWAKDVNQKQTAIAWQFTVANARTT